MPGQLIAFTWGTAAVVVALVWIAFLSARAVIRDHRSRTRQKQNTKH